MQGYIKNATMNSTGEQTEKVFGGQGALAVVLKDSRQLFLIVLMRDIQEYAVRAGFLKGVSRVQRN